MDASKLSGKPSTLGQQHVERTELCCRCWRRDGVVVLLGSAGLLRSGGFSSWPSSCRARGQSLLLLLLLQEDLLLDLLLLLDLRGCSNLGCLAVECDFGLFEVAAGICDKCKYAGRT